MSATEPQSVRERNRVVTVLKIQIAALELFESKGYARTTVEQITRRAGSSSATFFRHFGSKQEVLFGQEKAAEDELMQNVANRTDRAHSLAALADPFTQFAARFLGDPATHVQRMTRLVMTTKELEEPSMRMRLNWEHAVGRQLRTEDPSSPREAILLAGLAVSCLSSALWTWQQADPTTTIEFETQSAFTRATALCALPQRAEPATDGLP